MPDQIANYQKKDYSGLVMQQADISGSILSPWCETRSGVRGTSDAWGYLGMTQMVPKGSRHAPTPSSDILHRMYWADLAGYHDALSVDRMDEPSAFSDPKSAYVQKPAGAIGRQYDAIIAAAARANATYGSNRESTETWSSFTDRNSVSHVVAATGGAVNLTDVLKLRRIFNECEIHGNLFAWVSPRFMEKFLNITEVKSSDFNTKKVLEEGECGYFLGFNWVVTNALYKTGNTRSCFFGQRGVIGLSKSIDQTVDIWQRSDRSGDWEVYYAIAAGGVRRDPERIIEYTFTES